MMKSDKGLTLIEVLAAVVTLALVILAVTYLLTNSQNNVMKNTETTESVNVARTVMEHIKSNLNSSLNEMTIYSQTVNLATLRDLPPQQVGPISYPSIADNQLEITIRTELYSAPVEVKDHTYDLKDYFHLVTVTIVDTSTNTEVYELQNYAEY